MTTTKKPKKDPELEKVDKSGSFETARQSLQKRLDEVTALKLERDQWKAAALALAPDNPLNVVPLEVKDGALRSASVSLFPSVAWYLMLAQEITHPQQAHTHDQTGYHDFDTISRPMPGSSTAAPRSAATHFRKSLWKAVNEFQAAKERNWQRRREAPVTRCGIRDCARYGIKVPAWEFKHGRTLPNEKCSSCGTTLPRSED